MLIFIIALATVLPVPMNFPRKDNLPKFQIEQIDELDDDDEEHHLKEIF